MYAYSLFNEVDSIVDDVVESVPTTVLSCRHKFIEEIFVSHDFSMGFRRSLDSIPRQKSTVGVAPERCFEYRFIPKEETQISDER